MFAFTDLEAVLTEPPSEREETFPMQEQVVGPVRAGTEKPAAVVLAERLAEAPPGAAAPVFIP